MRWLVCFFPNKPCPFNKKELTLVMNKVSCLHHIQWLTLFRLVMTGALVSISSHMRLEAQGFFIWLTQSLAMSHPSHSNQMLYFGLIQWFPTWKGHYLSRTFWIFLNTPAVLTRGKGQKTPDLSQISDGTNSRSALSKHPLHQSTLLHWAAASCWQGSLGKEREAEAEAGMLGDSSMAQIAQ